MADLLFTGFPGFLASELLPLALEQRPGTTVLCLVQPHHMSEARRRLKLLDVQHPGMEARVELVSGDITESDLGLADHDCSQITEVFHLAAVYDPEVSAQVADAVNIAGTQHVLDLCAGLPALQRLHYVSTCYVAGDHRGRFGEDDLELGQTFSNHYVRSKYEAEVLVRQAMADGLPATIYRPGMVVGDSRTGQTQKFDGPYFVILLLQKLPAIVPLPRHGDIDHNKVGLVPRDYVVAAIAALSVMPESLGRTYALTDPDPPSVRQAVETLAGLLGRDVRWVPLPAPVVQAVARLPLAGSLLGVPIDAVVDYMAHPTSYDTGNAIRDLAGTGVSCPLFSDYASAMVDFAVQHPEVGSAAMT